jgi:hypothetical protein
MTRSLFDPTGPDAEHGGSRNLGPDAADISHLPPDVTDGDAADDESAQTDQDQTTDDIAGARIEAEQEQKSNPDEA